MERWSARALFNCPIPLISVEDELRYTSSALLTSESTKKQQNANNSFLNREIANRNNTVVEINWLQSYAEAYMRCFTTSRLDVLLGSKSATAHEERAAFAFNADTAGLQVLCRDNLELLHITKSFSDVASSVANFLVEDFLTKLPSLIPLYETHPYNGLKFFGRDQVYVDANKNVLCILILGDGDKVTREEANQRYNNEVRHLNCINQAIAQSRS